jgi:hypothetical protein
MYHPDKEQEVEVRLVPMAKTILRQVTFKEKVAEKSDTN